MNKTELVAAMAKDTNLSRKDVESCSEIFYRCCNRRTEKRREDSAGWIWNFRSKHKSCKRGKKSSDW